MFQITLHSAGTFHFNLELYGGTLWQKLMRQSFVLPKSHSNLYYISKKVDAKVEARCLTRYYFHMDNKDAITCISLSFYYYSSLKFYRERNDKDKNVCVLLFAERKHFDLIKKKVDCSSHFTTEGKLRIKPCSYIIFAIQVSHWHVFTHLSTGRN